MVFPVGIDLIQGDSVLSFNCMGDSTLKQTPFLNNGLSGVRRLVIVEAGSKRVEGIISLSDIFKFLLG